MRKIFFWVPWRRAETFKAPITETRQQAIEYELCEVIQYKIHPFFFIIINSIISFQENIEVKRGHCTVMRGHCTVMMGHCTVVMGTVLL